MIGGLALAFVIVFIHPQLLLRPAAPAAATAAAGTEAAGPVRIAKQAQAPRIAAEGPAAANSAAANGASAAASAPLPDSFAAAVRRAAPAVVNISTRRLVTEQIQPSVFDQL
ncbi:MAG TPA: hypothetical protein VNE18_10590, partial [Rhodanobacter sp.]|nr:hypothetical protein [Rhodanobacter sp.]